MISDIEIARSVKLQKITKIASNLKIPEDKLIPYGWYKAKVDWRYLRELNNREDGKLIMVTAITPTPAGEGKTTTTIGLAQALAKLNKKAMLCIREPSLGPCFGIKGGAAGGGMSQVLPMEEINLHFTGDIHAVGAAHNLLSAIIDNHIYQENSLNIDPRRVKWGRVIDMNDRALRKIIIGLGGPAHGIPRESRFDITAASEVMAILCLSKDMDELKERLGNIVVAQTYDRKFIKAKDLRAQGAMAALLKDALSPNLVQTIEGVPAFVHGGPFANIAHGTNSIIATKMALKLCDYTVVETGFATDLGAEKFFNIVCRTGGFKPDAVVIVTTIRALKMHGGKAKEELNKEDLEALEKGCENLKKHIENIKLHGLPVVVALNKFIYDTSAEIKLVRELVLSEGARFATSEVWERGGEGGIELALEVLKAIEEDPNNFKYLYELNLPIKEKIERIAKFMYGADGVEYDRKAEEEISELERAGYKDLPLCMAKTQLSLSDDPNLKGRPSGFKIKVRDVLLLAGAGFIVPIAGDIMTMPGLPKKPAAELVDIDSEGNISGLF
ncbi:MAG: formate--tetrahydrofolate ligase [Synergistetes bacterium]|nr:formate--tetrahydrofolate ligase [Synergistota bacterium]MCX8128124.1 formate--tetrahydrofolate ligase [Synergistota bacterium]MDW8192500.1 formate--tetrahydrofolate ligase [Synergistota bacterium]